MTDSAVDPTSAFLARAPVGSRWRHLKTGGTYRVTGHSRLQTADFGLDMALLVGYRSDKDGSDWHRPLYEFLDGRFEPYHEQAPAAPAADARQSARTAGEHRDNVLFEAGHGPAHAPHQPTCLDKAADDEPVFVLRAQDRFAPDVVEHWTMLVDTRNGGRTTAKTAEARLLARDMRAWQRTHGSKVPD